VDRHSRSEALSGFTGKPPTIRGLPSALCENRLVSLPPLWTYLVCIWLRSSYLLRLTHARCKHQREGCDELYTLSGIDAGRAHD